MQSLVACHNGGIKLDVLVTETGKAVGLNMVAMAHVARGQ